MHTQTPSMLIHAINTPDSQFVSTVPEMNIEFDDLQFDRNIASNVIINYPPCQNNLYTYPYTQDLLQLEKCTESTPESLPAQAIQVTTPLIADQWEHHLKDHPDRNLVRYILQGIREGFRIGFNRDHKCKRATCNMRSAITNPQPVSEFIQTELKAGRIVGPLPDIPEVQISRFGVIPKPGQPGKWRLILDLSSPHAMSVNDGVSPQLCSIRYATVDNAVSQILLQGANALLAKIDIEHAYRNIPIHPSDRRLLGMHWEGNLYVDTVLPFGLRSAPKIFSAVADTLEWIALQAGVTELLHYLDDFLTMGVGDSLECSRNLQLLVALCTELGVPLKWQKLEGPLTTLTFLGIVLDTQKMEMRLPKEELEELKELITKWLARKAGKKRDLLSLIGKLAHAAKIIVPGRIFLRRMIDVAHKAKQLDHWVHLTGEFKSDLAWWHCFIDCWNGLGMMQSVSANWSPKFCFSTDASGSWGCGACWKERWIQCPWNGVWNDKSIAAKELLPILLAVAMWGPFWQGNQILVQSDNMSVVNVIAANTSKDKTIMHLLRGLHFICAFYNINLRATHIKGTENLSADAVSRDNLQVFFRENPTANKEPTQIPEQLWEVLVMSQSDLAVAELEKIAGHLLKDSIADSTRRSYATGQTSYLTFCNKLNVQPLPATEQVLILFTADLSQRLAYSTIRAYLSAVRFLHISSGHSDPLSGKLKLDLLLRGVRKRKPSNQDKRLPITPLILEKIFSILSKNPTDFENKLLWAACCLGFFGFLRSGEFTTQSDKYDQSWHLSIQDISVDSVQNPSLIHVNIKGSKTDQLRQGVTIVVGKTKSHICPVKSVLAYVACRGFKPGPLFCHRDGSPLTRSQLVKGLRTTLSKAGVECDKFSGHSFRIGAATTAAAKGMADSTIQTLGRWKSDSFKRYIRMPHSELAAISAQLLN